MKKALFIILITLCMVLTSCVSSDMSCANILNSLLAVSGEDTEGNGIIYFDDVEEGEIGYLSRDNKVLLYSENRIRQLFDEKKIEDYAMFFSTRGIGEIAVFKCYSGTDCGEVARMCLERTDEIKVLLRKSEWREKSENIRVVVSGKYVLMIFVQNADKVESRFKSLI